MSERDVQEPPTKFQNPGDDNGNGALVFVELCQTFMYGERMAIGIPAGKNVCAVASARTAIASNRAQCENESMAEDNGGDAEGPREWGAGFKYISGWKSSLWKDIVIPSSVY